MIIKGSMGYTASGRRKKTYNSKRKPVDDRRTISSCSSSSNYRDSIRSHNPSNPPKSGRQTNTTQYLEERRAISSKYTIAPAYNKGAYQVISQDNVEDIGR